MGIVYINERWQDVESPGTTESNRLVQIETSILGSEELEFIQGSHDLCGLYRMIGGAKPVLPQRKEVVGGKWRARCLLPDQAGLTCTLVFIGVTTGKTMEKDFTTWRRFYVDVIVAEEAQGAVEREQLNRVLGTVRARFRAAYVELVVASVTHGGVKQVLTRLSEGAVLFKLTICGETWLQHAPTFTYTIRGDQVAVQQSLGEIDIGASVIYSMRDCTCFLTTTLDTFKARFASESTRSGFGDLRGVTSISATWPGGNLTHVFTEMEVKGMEPTAAEVAVPLHSFGALYAALVHGDPVIINIQYLIERIGSGQALVACNEASVTRIMGDDEDLIVTVLHELGHLMRLNQPKIDSYPNPHCFNDTYGGRGNHCNFNCHTADANFTTSGKTYIPVEGRKPCVMYYKLVPEMRGAEFCEWCRLVLMTH